MFLTPYLHSNTWKLDLNFVFLDLQSQGHCCIDSQSLAHPSSLSAYLLFTQCMQTSQLLCPCSVHHHPQITAFWALLWGCTLKVWFTLGKTDPGRGTEVPRFRLEAIQVENDRVSECDLDGDMGSRQAHVLVAGTTCLMGRLWHTFSK